MAQKAEEAARSVESGIQRCRHPVFCNAAIVPPEGSRSIALSCRDSETLKKFLFRAWKRATAISRLYRTTTERLMRMTGTRGLRRSAFNAWRSVVLKQVISQKGTTVIDLR
jgi:hypothetical protein